MMRPAIVSLIACSQLILPFQLLLPGKANAATPVRPATSTPVPANQPSGRLNFDLTSTKANLPAGALAANGNLSIRVGHSNQLINAASLLTPAELAAAYQVASAGRQTLLIGARGNAVGGSFNIGNSLANTMSNLVVPHNVKAVDNAALLNLTGALTNAGNMMIAGSPHMQINATDIFNTGSIFSLANLNLNVSGQIVNSGLITSQSGNLSMAANSITNNAGGYIQAANNVNLNSAKITNAGTISAVSGNLNINTASPMDIVINNTGGTLQALLGDVNVRDASFTAKNNLQIDGGSLLANNLNLYSGTGNVNVNVKQLDARVNASACEAHIGAATGNLVLGDMNLLGDPSFYNTAGSVTITGSLTFSGQAVAIVANTDIITTASGSIDTSSSTGNGGDVILIAGANFTATPNNSSPTASGAGDTSSTLKIIGGSKTGGFIDLTGGSGAGGGNKPVTIDTSSSSVSIGNDFGGDVTLVAYGGTGNNSGTINLPTGGVCVKADGNGPGVNGTISMIAGSSKSGVYAINIGGLSTTGATSGGLITLNTATPKISGSSTTVTIVNGAIQPGSGTFSAGAIKPTSVILNDDVTAFSEVDINAGANISWYKTGTVGTTIQGLFGPFTTVFNPSGTRAYVTNFGSNNFNPTGNTVSVIDTSTNSIVDTITVGTMPSGIAIDPTGTYAYVTNYNVPAPTPSSAGVPGPGSISIVDLQSDQVVGTILGIGQGPAEVAFNPTGTRAYVANFISNTVSVIDTSKKTVIATINVGLNPNGLAINPQGTVAYVTNTNSNSVSVINLSTNKVTTTISGLQGPYIASFNPAGTVAYVSNAGEGAFNQNTVSVIDTKTNKVTGTIGGISGASGVDFNPNGTLAFVTAYGFPSPPTPGNTVSAINTSNNTIAKTLDVSPNFFVNGVNFSPSGAFAYVGNYNDGTSSPTTGGSITRIDLNPPQIKAGIVSLNAGVSGNGSVSAFTQTSNLTATAKGNVSVYNRGPVALVSNDTAFGTKVLHSGAVGTFKLVNTPNVPGDGSVLVADTVTVTGTNSKIVIQSGEASGGTGGIGQGTSPDGLLSASTVSLSDIDSTGLPIPGNGTIGGNPPLSIKASFLSVIDQGNVDITDSLAVTINAPSSGVRFSLTDTALSGGIKLSSPLAVTTQTTLTTSALSGTAISQLATAPLSTGILSIILGGTSKADLSTSVNNNVGELSGIASSACTILLNNGGNNIQLDAFGNKEMVNISNGALISSDVLPMTIGSLTASGNAFSLAAQIGNSSTTNVTLTSSGNIAQTAGTIQAGKVFFTTTNGTVLGPAAGPLLINSPFLSVHLGGGGTSKIQDSVAKPVTLSNSVVSGGLTFSANNSITTSGTVTADTLAITANGSTSSVTVAGPLGNFGGNTSITTSNAGAITTTGKGQVFGLTVTLQSGSGDINAKTTASADLEATTGGNVTLTNLGSGFLSYNGLSAAGGNFTCTATGGFQIAGNVTAGKNLTVTAPNLVVYSGAVLTAQNGNLVLNSNDQLNGTIELQQSAILTAGSPTTGLGNVTISVGSARPAQTNTTTPLNVTPSITSGGKVFYGKNSINALNASTPPAGNNLVTATGRTITFSTGTAPSTSILLDGQVSITAKNVGYSEAVREEEEVVIDTGEDADAGMDMVTSASIGR